MATQETHTDGFLPPPQQEASEVMVAGIDATTRFLEENAGHLGKIFGIDVGITVGRGWATDLETGDVTADPRFFIEKGYTPDMAAYATMHEVAAHLREIIREPTLTREVIGFVRQGKAQSIFHNIFSDVAGNNFIHATLPATKETAKELYEQKLFRETDFTDTGSLQPRHLQFLYKIIRQEMIEDSDTAVFPEVDQLIDEFRNFQGTGDLIKYSTAVATGEREDMPAKERFDIWTKVIYPKYLELLAMDKQDERFQKSPGGQGDGTPSKDGDQQEGQPDFSDAYTDYAENRHPEPMDDDQHKQIHRAAQKRRREQEREERGARDPMKRLDAQIQAETGHSLQELKKYQAEIERWRDQIQEMRDIYKLIINERITTKRRLQGGYSEGVMLSPETLSQTFIDVRSGVSEPAAFMNYEHGRAERTLTGKTDWVFVFDRSGSMQEDERYKAASAAAVISLEGLAAMQRDIKSAEQESGAELDLDIRTALYTFNGEVECPKSLSRTLTEKQRLDTYAKVSQPNGGNADSVVLKIVEGLTIESDRRKVLVVVSDGEADDTDASLASVKRLRKNGWLVFGVAIGSEAAEKLYAPDSQRVDDPTHLPDAIKKLIEANL